LPEMPETLRSGNPEASHQADPTLREAKVQP